MMLALQASDASARRSCFIHCEERRVEKTFRSNMASGSMLQQLARQAQFVFKGTVRRSHASTMTDLTPDGRTAIVRVDDIIQAPAPFAALAGQDITVQVG